MAAFNDEMVQLILKVFDGSLIRGIEVSVDAIYRNVTTGDYSPSTGQVVKTVKDIPVNVIEKNVTSAPKTGDNAIGSIMDSKSSNERGEYLEFLVRPIDDVIPSQGIDDELILRDRTYKVISLRARKLGSDKLIYEIKSLG